MAETEIGKIVVDGAVPLPQALGRGLLESVYEVVMTRRLEKRGLSVSRQVPVASEFEGERFAEGFRADLIVNEKVVVERKSVEQANPAHQKQVLAHLQLTGLKLGYPLNFGETLRKDGIARIINGQP